MTVYLTKYALSEGILERQVDDAEFYAKGAHVNLIRQNGKAEISTNKRFLCSTKSVAIIEAKRMQQIRIANLERQLAKLKSLNFDKC